MTSTHDTRDRARRRAAIESIIASYPHIDEPARDRLFDYFRREATARDRAAIAANRSIRPQYRQLLRDHRLDWLPWVDVMVALGIVFLLVLGVLYLAFGGNGGPS